MKQEGKVTKVFKNIGKKGPYYGFYMTGFEGSITTFEPIMNDLEGKEIVCDITQNEKDGKVYNNATNIRLAGDESEDDYGLDNVTEIPMKEMGELRSASMPELNGGRTAVKSSFRTQPPLLTPSVWEANRDFHIRVGMACKQALEYLLREDKMKITWSINNGLGSSEYIDIVKKFYFLNEQAEKELIKDLSKEAFR